MMDTFQRSFSAFLKWMHPPPLTITNGTYPDIPFSFQSFKSLLFFTNYYSLVITFQTIFICCNVRQCAPRILWWQSYLLSGFMTFAGQYIALFMTVSISPILEHPIDILLFSILWFAINCSTNDFFYRFFSTRIMTFILQILFCLIQVRLLCFGAEIGLKTYPTSLTGAFLVAIINCSMDSFIWMMFDRETRNQYNGSINHAALRRSSYTKGPNEKENYSSYSSTPNFTIQRSWGTLKRTRFFSNAAIFRNTTFSLLYLLFLNGQLTFSFAPLLNETIVKAIIVAIYLTIFIVEDILYGLNSADAIDITGLSYLGRIFTYYG